MASTRGMISYCLKRSYGEKCRACRGSGYLRDQAHNTLFACGTCDGHGSASPPIFHYGASLAVRLDALRTVGAL